jgi:5'-nucleotidase
VGTSTAAITRLPAASGESALGNLIADAQLAATTDKGAVAALMDPGGVRADLEAGPVTDRGGRHVQPFGDLSTVTLTGAQRDCVQEQPARARATVLQPVLDADLHGEHVRGGGPPAIRAAGRRSARSRSAGSP